MKLRNPITEPTERIAESASGIERGLYVLAFAIFSLAVILVGMASRAH
jgi:hypothetical protein